MAYSSQEDGDGLSDSEHCLAEQYGTPPIRHSLSQTRIDKLNGPKKIRKTPSHTELTKKDKPGRKHRHATKYERQKERLDARAFKELDTTLQVLGIDGNSAETTAHRITASPHTPILQSEAKPPLGAKDSVSMGQAPSSRLSLESSSSLASDGRPRFSNAAALSLSEQRRSGSPLAFLSRVSSRADSLADERQKWLEGLDDLLQGNLDHDDLQVALSLASSKADDLKEQLIYWQTPPEPTWRAREERIDWLYQAMAQLKDVTIGLQQHGINIKDSSHMSLYHSILKEVLVEMGNMTDMCCDAIIEGLQALKDSSQDLQRAYRTSCRLISLVAKPLDVKRRGLKFEHCGYTEYLERATNQCIRVLVAMMDAAADLQAALLQASSLTVSLGKDVSAHEVSDRCKQLQFAWSWCAEMTALLNSRVPEQASTVNCAWCALLLNAAGLANSMQQDLLGRDRQMSNYLHATCSGLSDDSISSYGNTAGVWCTSATTKELGNAASDEELQAQAWLPACLTGLLANAQNAASVALGCGCGKAADGSGAEAEGDWNACQGLVEELSNALYELAVTGNHRIGRMCVSPSGLACWALELLEEQACQAVVFVRDLDRSVLGRGEHGLTHYEVLRQATDTLVNSIFRVRRLLKQKRTADSEDALPRPLPGIARSDSQSSLTAALQRKPAALQTGNSVPERHPAPSQPNSRSARRPPLAANGHAEASQRTGGSGSMPRNIPASRYPTGESPLTEQPDISGRRQRSRHRHGSATPPIPEDSDGEAGRSRRREQQDSNGLDHRDARSRPHSRRHRYKSLRQQPRRSSSSRDDSSDSNSPDKEEPAAAAELAENDFDTSEAAADDITDPFAQTGVEDQTPQPRGSASLPLAVFSSANIATPNSLMPEGSRKTINFGSFSSSPSQGNGVQSPTAASAAVFNGSTTPFAGFRALQNGASLEKEGSDGSSRTLTPLNSTGVAVLPKKDSSGSTIQARKSSKESSSDSFGHPMSDPTNGYHHLYSHPALLGRASGSKLQREGSSDSSNESSTHGQSLSAVEASDSVTAASSEQAFRFKLPWDSDPFWQISWESLKPTIVRKIGNGSFGQVFEVYYHSAPMAIKIINIDGDATALPGALLRFKQEVDLQRMLSHFPYIVRFVGACCHIPDAPPESDSAYTTSNVTLAIVMELCRFGTLFKLIEFARKVSNLPPDVLSGATPPRTPEEKRLKASPGFRLFNSWQLRLELAKHAAAAVEFMHSKNVIHRDLTSYNLLVTDKFEAKVADFNLSRAMKGQMIPSSGVINSPEWAAPERLSGQRTYNGFAADVFSFGVILWELVTLAWPWHESEAVTSSSAGDVTQSSSRSRSGGVPEPDSVQQPHDPFFTVIGSVPRGERLKFPACEDVRPPLPQLPQVVALAEACWRQNPAERPTMTEVCVQLDAVLDSIKQEARQRRRA